MHTCLRRLRFSYLVVLCAPSDWKSGHLYATPAGGSIRCRSGKRFNSCFWWYSIWGGLSVNLKVQYSLISKNIPLLAVNSPWPRLTRLTDLCLKRQGGWVGWAPSISFGHHRPPSTIFGHHWEPLGTLGHQTNAHRSLGLTVKIAVDQSRVKRSWEEQQHAPLLF